MRRLPLAIFSPTHGLSGPGDPLLDKMADWDLSLLDPPHVEWCRHGLQATCACDCDQVAVELETERGRYE